MPIYDRTLERMSRRELMKLAWMLGAAAVAPPILTRRAFAKPIFDAYPFSLGVASGDPLPDGVVLWTRLAPKALEGGGMPMVNVDVDWEIARDARFNAIVQKGTAIARPELGHSVHVEVSGLEPGREYWYRFHAGDEVSRTGRTKTAPPAGSAIDRLRFAVCGCNHYEMGYFTAFRRIAEEQFDFVFHTGDYIYEGRPDGGRSDRRLPFGNLIEFSVLDTRQWRSDQACGDGNHTDCAEALDPTRTMMGAEQEKWLFDNLADVKARWTVIGQQVPTYARDMRGADPEGRFSMDKWDGYVAARQRLYARLQETKAPNPIVLSGDVHMHYGADLKVDFTNPRSATVGVELTNTAITSTGDGSDVAPTWDATKGDNPHIKYHSARRGYIACTATPSSMRADFKILDKVTVPDLPIRTGGSLIVQAGRSGSFTD